MTKSIFDSKSERTIFKRLKTFWSKYVDVFPQIPVRNVIEYQELKKFDKNPKVTDFLLKTSFDFVVCELETGNPILVIEFDGLSGGFSQDGKFFIESVPDNDQYRKLKMDTKLRVCSEFRIPMIVVSYNESNLLSESGDWISILDAIIGDAIEKRAHEKNYSKYIEMLTEAYEFGGQESAELATIEIEMINERYNPIKRKIREITNKFPRWPTQIVFPQEEGNWLVGKFKLTSGFKTEGKDFYQKVMMEIELKIRKVGVFESDNIFLFNTIGEYCLARKVEKELGSDSKKWTELNRKTEWTK